MGLCGTAVMKDGENTALRDLSSAAVRIAREQRGIGEAVAPRLFRDGRYQNTLLLSPPGGGKTTLLRDLGAVPLLRRHRQAGSAGLPYR